MALVGCDGGGETTPPVSTAPCEKPRFAEGRDSVQCGELVDPEGRVIFLHGVNARVEGIFDVTFDDGRTALEPIPAFTEEDAARMRAIGFNALRLPINWSALEPSETGGFNESYLDKVEATVNLCGKHGIRTLVDFHQDAYSKEIGEDGAPLWAILPPPTQLLEGPLTDLAARRASKQVLDAFATFFTPENEDGKMLRDRFAKAVAHVAERFAQNAYVTGIEIYNEPVATDEDTHVLHDEVISFVRPVDEGRLYYFEPSVFRNLKDKAPTAKRDPWPGTVYAPHVYTLSFDGTDEEKNAMTKETLRPSNESARNEADSWEAPLVVGEFGYDPKGIQAENYLAWQVQLQDETQASGFLWVWKEQSQDSWGMFDYDDATGLWTERDAVRKAVSRVVPEAVAGWPESFGYDPETKRFEMTFTGDPTLTAPHLIYVPAPADFAENIEVTCDGEVIAAERDSATGLIQVPCGTDGAKHTLVVAAK